MLFKRNYVFKISLPIHEVHEKLRLGESNSIAIRGKTPNYLTGTMLNQYGFGYDLQSSIGLESISTNETLVEINNQFDLFTNIFVIIIYVVLWGLTAKYLLEWKHVFPYQSIITFIFPIAGTIITYYSFKIYHARFINEIKRMSNV